MARHKVFGGEINRKAIPRADYLAIIAAKDAVADRFSKFYRNWAEVLDCKVRDAFSGIDLKGGNDRISRASFNASCALAAVVCDRLTRDIDTFREQQFA